MTDRPEPGADEVEAIARQVRDLPPVEADSEFRRSLREAFVHGRIGPSGHPAGGAPPQAVRSGWRLLLPLAAALVGVALFAALRATPLRVVDLRGTGTIRVDGHEIASTDREILSRAVHPGAVVEVGDGVTLDLQVPRFAVYELTPGTRMTLPPAPRRWTRAALACSLHTGELRLATGRRFHGNTLTVTTPNGIVVVRGTLLSVAVDDSGTCVCVLEGVASVGVDREHLDDVRPGFRKVMLVSGETSILPVKDMHRDGVVEFDSREGGALD
jgi:hypothetical protein